MHVFPNGEVKTLANMSKDFSYYVITVGVPFDDDPDRVAARACATPAPTLHDDPEFQPHILEPLEVYGVDAFGSRARWSIKATDQDRAAEAVDGRTRAAEADRAPVPRTRHRRSDSAAPRQRE